MNIAESIHRAVAAVAPIAGVSIGRRDDKATWRIDFRPEATSEQRAAAEAVVAGLDAENPPAPVPATISDRQFFHALALEGEITQAEALAAVRVGAIPAALQAVIDTLPEAERFDAEMLVSGATVFERAHGVVELIGTGLGRLPEEIDDLWRFAATL